MIDLDIAAVRAFVHVADLRSFTRAAEALGTTQAAISMRLQRLEALLERRLLERSPRSVGLTAEGSAFLDRARALIDNNDRAVASERVIVQSLRLGISDHVAGPDLVPLLARLGRGRSDLRIEVSIGFSRDLVDAFDRAELDAICIRESAGRRGGETLLRDEFGWFAAPDFDLVHGAPVPLASLAAPCGVRATAVRALDKARVPWTEVFVGGGVSAVVAAALAGLAVAPLAKRIAPPGLVDVGAKLKLPRLPASPIVLHSRVSDASRRAALRTLAATFRQIAG
ncbi:LysR family transcriptional regulator [Rhodopseudomonas palustris]|uniref:LysR family transcriptional regulator n=1 Tax=Rhodopseudomonas palustris TaxID=1076 RepID=UPI000D1B001A|nr:LysR family transcriptional regulator [Rhodopseudomonas palustris]AVT82089.1 LysR family transcriptional regulator [Rhodopseudomonas palustris]